MEYRPRRNVRSMGTRLDRLRTTLTSLSNRPYLAEIIKRLSDVVTFVSSSDCSNEDALSLIGSTEAVLAHLPQSYSEQGRFLFDAAMIQFSTQSWGGPSARISRMILPKYGNEWAHRCLYLPSLSPCDSVVVPRVDLVTFPGEDSIHDTSLIEYPWLYHELGHVLTYACDFKFSKAVADMVKDAVRKQRVRSIADSRANRERADSLMKELEQYWDPAQCNWLAEIAADTVSLWLCGPAFLAAFCATLDDENLNPYHLNQSHPPYEVRTTGLLLGASRLGWGDYDAPLRDRIRLWKDSRFADQRTNRYVACTNDDIIASAVSSSLEMCTTLNLPGCDEGRVKMIQKATEDYGSDFGPDLLLAAWHIYERFGNQQYAEWERATVQKLLAMVTL